MRRRTVGTIRLVLVLLMIVIVVMVVVVIVILVLTFSFNFLGLRKLPWDVLGKNLRLQEHQEHF